MTAAWYAVRLGIVDHEVTCRLTEEVLRPSDLLINILHGRYWKVESRVDEVLIAAGLGVERIRRVWIPRHQRQPQPHPAVSAMSDLHHA
jgi:hypothetical protein